MKVINIALRRNDGKVETDTVYREEMLTQEDIEGISERFDCDVIVSHVGCVAFYEEGEIQANTIIFNRKRSEENDRNESEVPQSLEATGS